MSDYENQMTEYLMQIKTNLYEGKVTGEDVETLISILLLEVQYRERLREQLDYALDTGGEYLENGYIEIRN